MEKVNFIVAHNFGHYMLNFPLHAVGFSPDVCVLVVPQLHDFWCWLLVRTSPILNPSLANQPTGWGLSLMGGA